MPQHIGEERGFSRGYPNSHCDVNFQRNPSAAHRLLKISYEALNNKHRREPA